MNPDTEENRRSEPERRPSSESSDQKGRRLGWAGLSWHSSPGLPNRVNLCQNSVAFRLFEREFLLCLETFAGISVDLQPVARVAWLNRPIWAGYSRLLGYAGFGRSGYCNRSRRQSS